MTEVALPLALLAAGLASGLHCAGMCGGISTAFTLVHKDQIWRRPAGVQRRAHHELRCRRRGRRCARQRDRLRRGRSTTSDVPLLSCECCGSNRGHPSRRIRVTPLQARETRHARLATHTAAGRPLFSGAQLAAGLRRWPRVGLAAVRPVYGALAAAVFSGGAAHGAVAMAAFGAGTLPRLFFAGVAAAKLRGWTGLATLRRLSGLGGSVWQTLACF